MKVKIRRNMGQSLQQLLILLDGHARLGTIVWLVTAEIRLPETGRGRLLGRA